MRAFQLAEHWASAELTALPVPFREFAELRLGVFGLGGIGGAIARRGIALGLSVAGGPPGAGGGGAARGRRGGGGGAPAPPPPARQCAGDGPAPPPRTQGKASP